MIPALDEFAPEVLLISAGFDAHRDDPLAQMDLSETGFEDDDAPAGGSRRPALRRAGRQRAGRRLQPAALGRSVVRHLVGMQDGT